MLYALFPLRFISLHALEQRTGPSCGVRWTAVTRVGQLWVEPCCLVPSNYDRPICGPAPARSKEELKGLILNVLDKVTDIDHGLRYTTGGHTFIYIYILS